jgi:hypothetical protein
MRAYVFVPLAGRFGSAAALPNASCSGECTAGYHCPLGSVSGTALACGSVTVFCPAASGSPLAVAVGWYSTPDGATPPATRTGTARCVPGEYCFAGVRRLCPGGNYSDAFGQLLCAVCPLGVCLGHVTLQALRFRGALKYVRFVGLP